MIVIIARSFSSGNNRTQNRCIFWIFRLFQFSSDLISELLKFKIFTFKIKNFFTIRLFEIKKNGRIERIQTVGLGAFSFGFIHFSIFAFIVSYLEINYFKFINHENYQKKHFLHLKKLTFWCYLESYSLPCNFVFF